LGWTAISAPFSDYLVVAGGGGGGDGIGGGGGAGGYRTSFPGGSSLHIIQLEQLIPVTVGAGGTGAPGTGNGRNFR
jgi:hypothetical protein